MISLDEESSLPGHNGYSGVRRHARRLPRGGHCDRHNEQCQTSTGMTQVVTASLTNCMNGHNQCKYLRDRGHHGNKRTRLGMRRITCTLNKQRYGSWSPAIAQQIGERLTHYDGSVSWDGRAELLNYLHTEWITVSRCLSISRSWQLT